MVFSCSCMRTETGMPPCYSLFHRVAKGIVRCGRSSHKNDKTEAKAIATDGQTSQVSLPFSGTRVGVCYGTLDDNLPTPHEVVEHYKRHKIKKMRLYGPDPDVLNALRGTKIQVILDVPRDKLPDFANSGQAAGDWVYWNIMIYFPDVRIKYVAVGNEVIPKGGSQNVLPAMRNVHNALKAANLHEKIKVTTAIDTGVLGKSGPPSACEFSSASMQYMTPIIQYLASIESPLLCNVHPYFTFAETTNMSLDYALFRSPGTVVSDGHFQYQNLFDAMVDSIYVAVEKVGGRGMAIVVSETGWPWNGGIAATLHNAGSYNWNIINHVGIGTPRMPGPLETFIFSMYNQNQKTGAETRKYFGLFHPDAKPVYPVQSTTCNESQLP